MSQDNTLAEMATGLVGAYVSNNPVQAADLQGLITATYKTLSGLGVPEAPAAPEYTPSVNPKKSVTPDHLVSLIDGKRYKSLKRHLSGNGLTPAEYRERYGLASDYPMVAPNYAKQRSELAKAMGLGQGRRAAAVASKAAPAKPKPAAKAGAAPAKGETKAKPKPAAKAAPETKPADAPAGDGLI